MFPLSVSILSWATLTTILGCTRPRVLQQVEQNWQDQRQSLYPGSRGITRTRTCLRMSPGLCHEDLLHLFGPIAHQDSPELLSSYPYKQHVTSVLGGLRGQSPASAIKSRNIEAMTSQLGGELKEEGANPTMAKGKGFQTRLC